MNTACPLFSNPSFPVLLLNPSSSSPFSILHLRFPSQYFILIPLLFHPSFPFSSPSFIPVHLLHSPSLCSILHLHFPSPSLIPVVHPSSPFSFSIPHPRRPSFISIFLLHPSSPSSIPHLVNLLACFNGGVMRFYGAS
ncbi:hypothetical protein Pmani_036510 [Petrolisthes manimaculis]|uniref:Uncharacterized protein n=1 Tax=Petrolisthes manimaculis TaxID=1843537 RepID=A0AAE1NK13_9EUCA|nr:hypothetical protein Pmani_036510 [Petrolisthes manimaculis]